jgi:hypothetical protein|tara:strand:+ start:161 stop:340 length:180 start_codon:yes stop_codon:yes gene_type:complete
MGVEMSFLMTLIITYINTGYDYKYIDRFLRAWTISLPVAMLATFLVAPLAQKFVDKITK